MRSIVVVAGACIVRVPMVPLKLLHFHRIARLAWDNLFIAAVNQLTVLPPGDAAGRPSAYDVTSQD